MRDDDTIDGVARCNVAVCQGCLKYEHSESILKLARGDMPTEGHWCAFYSDAGWAAREKFEARGCPYYCHRMENQRLHTALRDL